MTQSIQLGNLGPDDIKSVDVVNAFVESRAARLGIDLGVYEITINDETGAVIATRKATPGKVRVTHVTN